jgi:hypothetical protein
MAAFGAHQASGQRFISPDKVRNWRKADVADARF